MPGWYYLGDITGTPLSRKVPDMLAYAAAAVFALALLLDWLDENLGDAFTPMTLLMLGLLLLSLHLDIFLRLLLLWRRARGGAVCRRGRRAIFSP